MSDQTQKAFAAGLFDDTPPPGGLAAWNGAIPERRYAIYRNNVTSSLTGALASRFPAAEAIVGAAFFRAMARVYIEVHPPTSPVLLAYGNHFPDFVAAFEPARDLAYLPDVMRLEVARGRAYHAADIAPLDPAALAACDPSRLDTLVFTPHLALSVLSSPYPIATIWAMNAGERQPEAIDDWRGEQALITRPAMIVAVTPINTACAQFTRALAAGAALASAVDETTAVDPSFDLADNLAVLLRSGAFTAIRQDYDHEDRHDA